MNVINGRPKKITSHISEAILNAITEHIPYKIASESNGICERTFYNWLKKGSVDMEQGIESEFSQLLQSLRKIEANKIEMHLKKISETSKGHRGSQWILEHVFWRYFSSSTAIIELNERLERIENKHA